MTDIKVPPHDIEAEQRVLGAILINNDAMAAVIQTLVRDDFYRQAHYVIFDAMVRLWRLKEIDLVNLVQELSAKEFKKVGGKEYIRILEHITHSSIYVVPDALKVKALSVKRAVISWFGEICEEMMQEQD